MKTLTALLLCLIFALTATAQAPQGINFQALAKDGSNQVVSNSNVGLRISILDGSATGAVRYQETHTATTNEKGVFSIVVGQGAVITGQFDTLQWGAATKWIQIEMDAAGGTNYAFMNVQQLMSVPYALYAENSSLWQKGVGNKIYYNKDHVGIGTVNAKSKLHLHSDINAPNGFLLIETFVGQPSIGTNSEVNLMIQKARGSFAVPQPLVNGDAIGGVLFQGYSGLSNGTGFEGAVSIIARSTENWSATTQGAKLEFWTNPNGIGTGTKRVTIDNNGFVSFGLNDPKAKVHIQDGDVYLDNAANGIIMKTPNGQCFRVTLDNSGNFVKTAITCP